MNLLSLGLWHAFCQPLPRARSKIVKLTKLCKSSFNQYILQKVIVLVQASLRTIEVRVIDFSEVGGQVERRSVQ